jgi:prepilin-type N-terminal cleavage/methylation domain-containing protein
VRTRFHITRKFRQQRGFSLLELLIVLAITLVIGAMMTPKIAASMAGYEVRQSASQVAGLLQRARIAAVQANQPVRMRTGADASGRQRVWVDLPGGTAGTFDPGEPTIILPRKITLLPAGPGDPKAALTSNNTTWNAPDAQFNGRGLPCVTVGAVCMNLTGGNQQGYLYYVKGDAVLGVNAWAAVVVTPGGRIKSLMYSGTSYQ